MTLTSELADANAARWELARILLGKTVTGDIEELHPKCVEEAKRLVDLAEELFAEGRVGA